MSRINKFLLNPPILLIYAVIIIFGTIRGSVFIDPDFGWHLREGGEFFHHNFTYFDSYTFSETDFHPTPHEWLSDVILYMIYSVGGYWLLAFYYSLLIAIAIGLISKVKIQKNKISSAISPLISLGIFSACLPFTGIRTVVYSVLLLAITTKICENKSKNKYIILAIFIWLWAQLHGSFPIGIVYIIYYAIFIDRNIKYFISVFIGCALALINPFGFDLYKEIYTTMSDNEIKQYISEWVHGVFNLPSLAILLFFWWASFATINSKNLVNKIFRFDNLMIVASYFSVRQWALFAITVADTCQESLEWISWFAKNTVLKFILFFALLVLYGATIFTIYNMTISSENFALNQVQIEQKDYPTKSVEYLRENPCEGNVFHHFNFGGYLELRADFKTFIDGRGPSWKRPADTTLGTPGEKYLITYMQILTSDDDKIRDEEFERWNIQCVIMINDPDIEMNNYLNNSTDWNQIISDDGGDSSLWVKN